MDDKQLITINYKVPNSTTCQTANTNCPMLDIFDTAHPTCLLFDVGLFTGRNKIIKCGPCQTIMDKFVTTIGDIT